MPKSKIVAVAGIAVACLALLTIFLSPANARLNAETGALDGVGYAPDGLTDKQLGLQNWFAHMTLYNDGWEGWQSDTKHLGLDSYRYGLAFLGYAVAAMQAHTPAYREYAAMMLDHAIQRMIRKEVWDFIEVYWKDEPTFPDPVVFENIMYSGHLAQLIALYESITGDMKYETEGFDFVWDENTVIHYTGQKLMQVMYDQMAKDVTGGVPCEPDQIFVICQNHPHNAFALYDAIHGTNFEQLDGKWSGWMEDNAPIDVHGSEEYLKIVYHRGYKSWASAVSTPGADGWAISWMYPWNPDRDFVCEGYEKMVKNRKWKRNKIDKSAYLKADTVGTMFGVDEDSATSFFPFLEAQCDPDCNLSQFVYNWFGKNSRFTDEDGDGVPESFHYEEGPLTNAWINANLALGMTVRGNDLVDQYHIPRTKLYDGKPYLAHAGYPQVLVRQAIYREDANLLDAVVLPAGETTNARLVFENIGPDALATLNGQPFEGLAREGSTLIVEMRLDGEAKFQILKAGS